MTQRQQQQKLLQQTCDNQQTVETQSNSTYTSTSSNGSSVSVIEKLPVSTATCGTQVYTNKSLCHKVNGIRGTVLETSSVS